jgi:predicted permease
MESLLRDLRFAVRSLVARPVLAMGVIASLALGIGANVAMFSVVHGVLIRPLPYAEPRELVQLWTDLPGSGRESASYPDFQDWRDRSGAFAQVAAYANAAYNMSTRTGDAERIRGARVTPNLLATLGLRPALGRDFTSADAVWGSHRMVMLSHGLWMRRFAGDASVINTTVQLAGVAFTVIGVAPPEMEMPTGAELWTALSFNPASPPPGRRSDFLHVVARLKPGVTPERAQSELTTVATALASEYPQTNGGVGIEVSTLYEDLVGPVRGTMLALTAAVALLLLIACANVATLLLARASSRAREMAVRVALGARRGRLARQLATESAVLAVAGGLIGVVLASAGVAAFARQLPPSFPRLANVVVDVPVLAFAIGMTALTGLLFGLAPALQISAVGPTAALNAGGRAGIGGRSARVRSGLVAAQVALVLVLLAGSGLLIRSFDKLQRVDLGFDPTNVFTAQIALPAASYPEDARVAQFFTDLATRVGVLPGVETAGYATDVPLGPGFPYFSVSIEGAPPTPDGQPSPDAVATSADSSYFHAMGIGLLSGRAFTSGDRNGSQQVALVNEEFVRKHMSGASPIGQRISYNPADTTAWRTVVGVVATTKLEGVGQASYPQVFYPMAQNLSRGQFLVVRTAGPLPGLERDVRRLMREMDPAQPVSDVRTMDQRISGSIAQPRVASLLVSVFSIVALLLAAVGIYSIVAYSVAQRTREIGVRLALGATSREVVRWIVGRAMTPVAVGIVVGVAGALATTRFIAALLYDTQATDPLVFAGVTGMVVLIAGAASFVPARRAARVNPTESLRSE